MYGLPADFNPSVFVGCKLEMICFAEYQVYLHFSNNVLVSVESALNVNGVNYGVPLKNADFMHLVGHSVVSALGNKEGDLTVIFDDGSSLSVLDTEDQYESYRIRVGGSEIIV